MASTTSASPRPGAAPDLSEVRQDVGLALALARHGRPRGELTAALRRRLCGYIHALAPDARAWASGQSAGEVRDGHHEIVRQAVALAAKGDEEGETAERLCLLGKAADMLARMAGGRQHAVSRRTVSC